MDLFMKEIEAVRQVLHLDKLAVLGHSANVPIALEYAIRYPSRTSHLIMTPNTGPKYDPAYSGEHQTKHWEKYASEERKDEAKRLGAAGFFAKADDLSLAARLIKGALEKIGNSDG